MSQAVETVNNVNRGKQTSVAHGVTRQLSSSGMKRKGCKSGGVLADRIEWGVLASVTHQLWLIQYVMKTYEWVLRNEMTFLEQFKRLIWQRFVVYSGMKTNGIWGNWLGPYCYGTKRKESIYSSSKMHIFQNIPYVQGTNLHLKFSHFPRFLAG